jgi:hypothetical protein
MIRYQRENFTPENFTPMNRTNAKINPFLLPTCIVCGSPVSLSHVEPASDHAPEKRIYRCAECDAENGERAIQINTACLRCLFGECNWAAARSRHIASRSAVFPLHKVSPRVPLCAGSATVSGKPRELQELPPTANVRLMSFDPRGDVNGELTPMSKCDDYKRFAASSLELAHKTDSPADKGSPARHG